MTSTVRVLASFVAVRWCRPLRSRAAVERRQARLLRGHLRFLRARSPYFGELLRGRTFAELPLMDKRMMMDRFDEMSTVGIRRDEALANAIASERSRDFDSDIDGVSVGLSSGTSGHRGLFVVSPRERAAWVGTVLARTLPRGRLTGHRIALFLRADNSLYESVGSRAVSFSYFDVYGDMRENITRLIDFAPTILVAPPSVLRVISRAADDGRFTSMPQKVYAVAEVLEESDARIIAASLQQPFLHQLYQCTEGFLAHTCHLGILHLNEDSVLFEREQLDNDRFVPIITDLRRRAQPIVRYRLGDVLRVRRDPCQCGSALTAIDRIEGREDDTLELCRPEGGTVPVFADLVARALLYADGFEQYRVVQTSTSRWEIHLDVADGHSRQRVTEEIGALVERVGAVMPELAFLPFEHDRTVKLRRVMRAEKKDADETL